LAAVVGSIASILGIGLQMPSMKRAQARFLKVQASGPQAGKNPKSAESQPLITDKGRADPRKPHGGYDHHRAKTFTPKGFNIKR